MNNNSTKIIMPLEREMKKIFKEICHNEEDLNESVRDAMKAFTFINNENHYRRDKNSNRF